MLLENIWKHLRKGCEQCRLSSKPICLNLLAGISPAGQPSSPRNKNSLCQGWGLIPSLETVPSLSRMKSSKWICKCVSLWPSYIKQNQKPMLNREWETGLQSQGSHRDSSSILKKISHNLFTKASWKYESYSGREVFSISLASCPPLTSLLFIFLLGVNKEILIRDFWNV